MKHFSGFNIEIFRGTDVQALYNILFTIFFVLASPYYFWRVRRRGNWRLGFSERFGRYDQNLKQALTNRHILWLHAVSVGEVNVLIHLIRALEIRAPNLKFVVSTTTTTGMGDLRRRLPPHVSKIYYPIDRRSFVSRALATIHPDAVVLFETEIWPNFIWQAKRRGIPLLLANARLSDRSYPRYKRYGFLFRELFASFDGVGAQNEAEAKRLQTVGCLPETIRVTGNLKFDAAIPNERRMLDVPGLLRKLGVNGDTPILLGGSTHDGEEILLAEIARRLRHQLPKLFLILVPRHFERSNEVARQLRDHGVKLAFRTAIGETTQYAAGDVDCLLVNTTGELRSFYEYATVVFVGKSLTATGGQNPIEPGALGKAVIFGPNMQNFADIARLFVEKGGAIQVPDTLALEKVMGELLEDKYQRAELGRNALQVVSENLGATNQMVEMVLEKLKVMGVYITPVS
jgi:3-deoxy-D-manno-octulosonic-acid transferase